jgi:hypothetical protein
MRMLLCLSLFAASSVWAADAAADRAAIEKVVATLNSSPGTPGLFTDDFADNSTLIRLGIYRNGRPVTVPSNTSVADTEPTTIHLSAVQCVSHEPMGELGPCPATLNGLAIDTPAHLNTQSVRLLTADVALVDAVAVRQVGEASLRTPVLLVMRKVGDVWKIASVRVIARSPGQG